MTLGANIISGSTSYSIITSVSTLTLTLTSTVSCHNCGPPYATVTLSLVEIPSGHQQKYGPISTSISSYLVSTSPPLRTYSVVSSRISEFGKTSNEGSSAITSSAHVVTISLAHLSQSYGAMKTSLYESGSTASNNTGGIEATPANVVTVSLARPPHPHVTTLLRIYESSRTPDMGNGITRTGFENLFTILLGPPSETHGALPTCDFPSVPSKNTESTLNNPVIGATISLDLTPYAYGGTGFRTSNPSALAEPPSYRPEEGSIVSLSRSSTLLFASLSNPTPKIIPGHASGERIVPDVVPSNTSLPAIPHYTYHGPLYTGSASKEAGIFGGASAFTFLVAVVCGTIVV